MSGYLAEVIHMSFYTHYVTSLLVQVPVGRATLGRIMNVIGEPIDEKGEISKISGFILFFFYTLFESVSYRTQLMILCMFPYFSCLPPFFTEKRQTISFQSIVRHLLLLNRQQNNRFLLRASRCDF